MLGQRAVIFASVGSMFPFDRLVRAVDEWALANPQEQVFLQIGESAYLPQHTPWARVVPMSEYRDRLRACSLFVAHVGMGSILQALEERKQMLLLPRHQSLGEHNTEHQLHTAARFRDVAGIRIVDDADALAQEMSRLVATPLATGEGISSEGSPELIGAVRSFLAPTR